MAYITFTEEEKERAGAVDLAEFLVRQGEELERSGSEWRWKRYDSVTVRNNTWYRHSCNYGGAPIQFLQEFYDMTYVEAMKCLLEGNYLPASDQCGRITCPAKPKKKFQLPEANRDMKRVVGYLTQTRYIDYKIVSFFAKAGSIFEDKKRHNAVFVGFDHNGTACHAHMKGTYSNGESFRLNVEGSDPAYGFGYSGPGQKLYVFEAAIDLLSFLTLYPLKWQQQSYICLDGLSEHAMLQMLECQPQISEIILCLDHDPAGIEGCYRLKEILTANGYDRVSRLASKNKDWNEDLKEQHGGNPVPAMEHPKLISCMKLCVWLKTHAGTGGAEASMQNVLASYHHYRIIMERQETYREDHRQDMFMCLEDMAAAGFQMLLEIQRNKEPSCTREQLANQLFKSYQPHKDRGKSRAKAEELAKAVENLECIAAISDSKDYDMEQWETSCKQFMKVCMKLFIQQAMEQETQEMENSRKPQLMPQVPV